MSDSLKNITEALRDPTFELRWDDRMRLADLLEQYEGVLDRAISKNADMALEIASLKAHNN